MRTAIWSILSGLSLLLGAAAPSGAQSASGPYPAPASLEVFRYADPAEEIALARSAAPASISGDAEILVLGRQGYETAVKGKNGFVCFVDRSWSKPFDDPEFWNPKVRAPQCDNPQAVRTMMPIVRERTQWVMSGASMSEIAERTRKELAADAMPKPVPGNMVYMMSKQGYIADAEHPHWHAHIMFYMPTKDGGSWGAGSKGAPVAQADDPSIAITTYFVLVPKWSDGTSALMEMN
ncbi:MAG TPA: hypothetical protein VGL66_00180 [Caulobacteraceae bacterium]|jgi:hypothetical protein